MSSSIRNPGRGSAPVAWTEALNINFANQPSQTISPDGTYSIGGVTWTKINSANDQAAMAVVNGSGLVITPKSTSDYWGGTRTLPAITLPLTSIIPTIDITTPLRCWIHIASSNPNAAWDMITFVVENSATSTRGGIEMGLNPIGVNMRFDYAGGSSRSVRASPKSMIMVEFPHGLGAHLTTVYVAVSGLPFSLANLESWGFGQRANFGTFMNACGAGFRLASEGKLLIGAMRAGSGTAYVATIDAVKVDYVNEY